METYKAVFSGNSLYHINNIHGKHGWFGRGDGDGDGIIDDHHNQRKSKSEYSTSSRRTTDSSEAVKRLDEYYKNIGEENYTTTTGPSGTRRSANPYVDKDGNLTDAGKARLASEIKANNRKKSKDRASEEDLIDPKKWVQDDIKALTKLAESNERAADDASRLLDKIIKDKKNPRLDLSNMSDKEIRDAINRELMERQYNEIFNKAESNKTKERIKDGLAIYSLVSSQVVTGLTIAGLIIALTPK